MDDFKAFLTYKTSRERKWFPRITQFPCTKVNDSYLGLRLEKSLQLASLFPQGKICMSESKDPDAED